MLRAIDAAIAVELTLGLVKPERWASVGGGVAPREEGKAVALPTP